MLNENARRELKSISYQSLGGSLDIVFYERATLVYGSYLARRRPFESSQGSLYRPEKHGDMGNQGHLIQF